MALPPSPGSASWRAHEPPGAAPPHHRPACPDSLTGTPHTNQTLSFRALRLQLLEIRWLCSIRSAALTMVSHAEAPVEFRGRGRTLTPRRLGISSGLGARMLLLYTSSRK